MLHDLCGNGLIYFRDAGLLNDSQQFKLFVAFHAFRHMDYILLTALGRSQRLCLSLSWVGFNLCAYIVLFVGRAIRSSSHFIDWRDTWGPSLIGEGFPHKGSPQKKTTHTQKKSHESNDQYLRSHPAKRGGGRTYVKDLDLYMVAHFTSQTQLVSFRILGAQFEYVCSNMSSERERERKKRSGREIDSEFVSKKIVGVMCQDKR